MTAEEIARELAEISQRAADYDARRGELGPSVAPDGEYQGAVTRGSRAAYDRAWLLWALRRMKNRIEQLEQRHAAVLNEIRGQLDEARADRDSWERSAEYACESPCGDCGGCNLAAADHEAGKL